METGGREGKGKRKRKRKRKGREEKGGSLGVEHSGGMGHECRCMVVHMMLQSTPS